MQLLNPAALWCLALLAVLFLLRSLRLPPARRRIGNAYLWQSTTVDPRPAVVPRFRMTWLLFLQATVLLLNVAALARPVLETESATAAILDVSASMAARDGNRTRFDRAREAAVATFRVMPAATRVRVVLANRVPADRGEFRAGDPRLYALLDTLRPGAGADSLDAAISTARLLVGRHATLHIFTDQPRRDETVKWVQVGSPADNLAITALAVRRMPSSPMDGQVFIELWNYGAVPRTVPVTLSHAGQPIARDTVTVPPRAPAAMVRDVGQPAGVYTATIESGDALGTDDRRFALFQPAGPIPVVLVTSGNIFIRRALESNPALTVRTTDSLDVARLDGTARVIVCDRCRSLPQGPTGVLMFPSAIRETVRASLSIADVRHPVTALLDIRGMTANVIPFAAPPDARVLARAGAAPAITAYERDGQRVVVVSLETVDSDLPLHVAFPILLANAVDWLAGSRQGPPSAFAGDPVQWERFDGRGEFVFTPDGREVPLARVKGGVVITDTDVAGVYHLGAPGSDAIFVVNPITDSESDLSLSAAPTRRAEGMSAAHADVPYRFHLFPWFVVGTVLLSLLEWRYSSARRTA